MEIIDFIIIAGFPLIFIAFIMLISLIQLKQKKLILDKLNNYNFEKIRIRFLQSSVGKGSMVGGMPIKAEMYISEDLLLIAPKEKGYFNGINNLNLPVIFVKNENQKKEIDLNNIVVPDKINITTWNSIVIKYQKALIGNIKYSIQINLIDKSDIEKINKLKTWC